MRGIERIKKLLGLGREKGQTEDKPEEAVNETEQLEQEAIEAAREECRLNLNEEMRASYAGFLQNSEIKEKYILYEAFGGRGLTCSPYAIFCYLLEQPDFRDYVHVWVIEDFEDNRARMEDYRKYANVKFIHRQSREYREYLATAKYLINNVSFPGFFTKRKGQVYVDTWHGIPLKTLGFDIPSGKISAGNTARNFLAADYLISPNPFMTEIYKKAFKLEGLYEGTILEVGQPRNDRFFRSNRDDVLKKLSRAGVQIDPARKLILYAPTWKGSKYSSPDISLEAYFELIRCVESSVDTEKYQILVKPHQIVYYHIKNSRGLTGQFIPATVDTNELLSVVDILISDYSSIYFDFLVSGRPVLFFIPDLQEYISSRGLYFGIEKLPGPIAGNYGELKTLLQNVEKAMQPYKEVYERETAWACPQDDGEVCRRLVDAVFYGKESPAAVRCRHDRKKILIYPGKLEAEGTIFSFLELTRMINYDIFDVTVLAVGEEDAEERIYSLDPCIRVLYRGQPVNGTPEEKALLKLWLDGGDERVPEDFLRREIRRLFGDAAFDFVLDLTSKRNLFSAMTPWMGCPVAKFSEKAVDLARIQAQMETQSTLEFAGRPYYITSLERSGSGTREVELLPLPDEKEKNYIAMGSLEPESGCEELLHSFKAHSQKEENAHLYLLGDGTMKKQLEGELRELALEDRVTLTGYLDRPFGLLKLCDAFVRLPGQREDSLPVLEARTLELPVGGPDFEKIEEKPFDAESHNQAVYAAFEGLFHE